ncbi:GNAT family N-acetyltransferase [Hoeflea prorocentri]|uniref:GNAT family N-acetyltransferase n=1 Tax=Hoeflea prorocentri TaxID=1922333 RepID=A0A9X3UF53_9HYPH|nr:GNAT family N-acetyltransferase [Hoeflea prorocentri]MCY6379597.1 GNAT family N-acetyltransferase [Hoeflea prorocentri]MDA5397397.1 GNAT family N-acetyltransferase [Hoeflea prorocentri]
MTEITLRTLTGAALTDALDDLAHLRITVFHEWPYLYEGDMDYERNYLAKFAGSKGAVIIGAYDGDRLVGAATAAPLADHFDDFAGPFSKHGLKAEDFFYFGESVLLPEYRGHGIGVRFFEEREKAAQAEGFDRIVFCGVMRPDDHPMRPADYVPLDTFWRNRGYEKMDGIVCDFPWRDIGDGEETRKPMQFWSRTLAEDG